MAGDHLLIIKIILLVIRYLIIYVRAHGLLEKFRICMFVFHAIFSF